jgi:hypothetical protein
MLLRQRSEPTLRAHEGSATLGWVEIAMFTTYSTTVPILRDEWRRADDQG